VQSSKSSMSAPAQNKRKLKESADRLLRRAFARGLPYDFFTELKAAGELALIGGALRDAYLQGIRNFESDFDFVLHPRNLSEVAHLMGRYNAVENRFGGYRLELDRWKIDVWSLQNTWAQTSGHRRVDSFEDLLSVTFFDWDAVVYNLSTCRIIVDSKYFERIDSGILDVNLLPNPNPLGNAVRALRYAKRWGAAFGATLAKHVYDMLREHGISGFLDAERNSFRNTLLEQASLSLATEELAGALRNRSPTVNPLKGYETQPSLLPVLEGIVDNGSADSISGPPYDARAIANFILDLGDRRGTRLTQMSLLKILYFAFGWYLVTHGKRLIQQDLEAWEYGPVVKVVRDEFKNFGKKVITGRARKLDIFSGQRVVVQPNLNLEDANFISAIFESYHVYNGWKLSEMTHEEGSPWDRLWNASGPIGRLGLRIKDEDIKSHFSSLPKRISVS
jgi:uncharacterized phage-associated protein